MGSAHKNRLSIRYTGIGGQSPPYVFNGRPEHHESNPMFRVKTCGITSVEDAQTVARAGADAVGLNFYPNSPRCIAAEVARSIVDVLPERVVKVGLFVNAEVQQILGAFDLLGLDLIQLHGDEPPELIAALGDRPVMRAFRLGPAGLGPVAEYLRQCRGLGCMPQLVLIDSHVRGVYGGTGTTADWEAARLYPIEQDNPPLVLAGGLTPGNVAEAIRTVNPRAVDTASGVESEPGRKDPAAVEAFVRAACRAFGDT